jgi:hypothetical protein
MTNFAYVLMTYRNPAQLVRLARRLRTLSPGCQIVVRHDARRIPLISAQTEALQGEGAAVHEYTSPIAWGGWTMVDAQLRELRWLREQAAPDYVSFLSGQDYPVTSLAAWEKRVAAQAPGLWGEIREVAYRPRWLRRGAGDHRARRAMYRYRRLATSASPRGVGLLEPLVDAQRLPHSPDLFVGVRRPLGSLKLWWGLPWLTLSSRAADAVLDADRASSAKRILRHSLLPEESFIPTVVGNAPELEVAPAPLSYCRFPGHVWHPVTFTMDDLGELDSVAAPFARKFDDEVDSAVLDALDARVDQAA